MSRAAGEVRLAMLAAVREHGPMTLRDLVHALRLPTTPRVVRSTLQHLVREGKLVKAGHEKRAHCRKWVALYDLALAVVEGSALDAGAQALGDALMAWR